MICSNCGVSLSDPNIQTCPRCGQPLSNQPALAPDSGQFSTGPTPPGSQQIQPGFSPPATAQWMKPALAPAPAKPARSRSSRNLLAALVGILIIAACAGGIYLAFFAHGSPPSNGSQTPITGTKVLFSDPLTSNTNGWSDTSGHCFFRDNAYHINNSFICYAPAGNFGDANITVQAKQVAGSIDYGYGIVFRRTSTGNWYKFDIASNRQWAFFKSVNGTESAIVDFTSTSAIKSGLNIVNTLLVQAKGTHFVFFVNGAEVGEADDTTFSSGQSGLGVGGPIEVAYTNFEITAAS